jgi:PAS domain S-box-containing protein
VDRALLFEPDVADILFVITLAALIAVWWVLRRRTQLRHELRLGEETSRALLNASTDPSFLLDTDGNVLAMNQAARMVPGSPPAGVSFFSVVPPALVASRRAAIEQVIQSSRPLRLEDQFEGKHYEHSLHPVPDPGGAVTRLTFSTRDVTERHGLEATLQSTVQFLRQILESSTTVAIISTDRQGMFLFWNTGAGKVLGFSADETVGRMSLESLLPPDDSAFQETLMKVMTRVLGGQETVVQVIPVIHKDGRRRTLTVTFSPQYDNAGIVQGMLLIGEDITEREVARRETEQAERQLRLLAFTLNCAKDAFVITDLDNRILYVNQAFADTYGYTEEELIGRDVMMVRSPQTSEDLSERIRIGTRGTGWSGEVSNRRKTGEEFPVELWTSTVRNDQGEPVALVGVAREITERKATENQIRASLHEKEVLLKEIHHRVKNNLQVITSLLSLQSSKIPNTEIQAILKESQTRVKSMALVHEELYQSEDFSRVDFADYIRRLTSNLFRTYQTGPVPISLVVDVEDVYLTVDAAIPCGLIINELVSNALKHAFHGREEGIIKIHLQRTGSMYSLMISDNGIGLPLSVDPATAETLGLQLVSTLTRQLGGVLSLYREEGTRFDVQFAEQLQQRREG